jgi:hypothetical protein
MMSSSVNKNESIQDRKLKEEAETLGKICDICSSITHVQHEEVESDVQLAENDEDNYSMDSQSDEQSDEQPITHALLTIQYKDHRDNDISLCIPLTSTFSQFSLRVHASIELWGEDELLENEIATPFFQQRFLKTVNSLLAERTTDFYCVVIKQEDIAKESVQKPITNKPNPALSIISITTNDGQILSIDSVNNTTETMTYIRNGGNNEVAASLTETLLSQYTPTMTTDTDNVQKTVTKASEHLNLPPVNSGNLLATLDTVDQSLGSETDIDDRASSKQNRSSGKF